MSQLWKTSTEKHVHFRAFSRRESLGVTQSPTDRFEIQVYNAQVREQLMYRGSK